MAEFRYDKSGKIYRHNACTDPCDMFDGPCACGAWHKPDEPSGFGEFTMKQFILQSGKHSLAREDDD